MLTPCHCRFVLEVNRVVNNGDVSEVTAAYVCVCVSVLRHRPFFFSVSRRRLGDTKLPRKVRQRLPRSHARLFSVQHAVIVTGLFCFRHSERRKAAVRKPG
ncbi:unnamed protein product [Ixodes pacificus]